MLVRRSQLQVSYTDGEGTAESVTSAATTAVTNVSHSPTGGVTITGTPTEDEVLTADTSTLADEDGLGTRATSGVVTVAQSMVLLLTITP